jgi:hypothetical protein
MLPEVYKEKRYYRLGEPLHKQTMTKPNESDTIARLCLGFIIFLAMRFAPRAVEAWQKRKNMKGEMR